MSLTRAFRRNAARKAGRTWQGRSQPVMHHADGSISVLRSTKGWLRTSAKRLDRHHADNERRIQNHHVRSILARMLGRPANDTAGVSAAA